MSMRTDKEPVYSVLFREGDIRVFTVCNLFDKWEVPGG